MTDMLSGNREGEKAAMKKPKQKSAVDRVLESNLMAMPIADSMQLIAEMAYEIATAEKKRLEADKRR